MPWIFVTLIIFSIIEISIIILIGKAFGFFINILIIFSTALTGYILVRYQGLSVLLEMRREMSKGSVPAHQILKGAFLLIAAALLVIPGFISDIVGLLVLIPIFRNFGLVFLTSQIQSRIKNFQHHAPQTDNQTLNGDYIDITDYPSQSSKDKR